MAAVMSVNNHYGVTPSNVVVTNLRFKLADDNTQDTNNPCVIPSGADNHSYWKSIYLKCDSGLGTQIDNVKIYSDGALAWTNVTVYVGSETPTHNSGSNSGYVQAVGAGNSGTEMVAGYTGITGKSSLFGYTSAAPKSVSISETGNKIDANGESTNYVVLQLTITSTATAGTKPTETITFQYDEV